MSEKMNNITNEEEEAMTVTLTYEDGTEEECIVIDIFTIEELGEQEYVALLSVPEGIEEEIDENDEIESEILLYRYTELEDDEISLETIEDEDELQIVQVAFESLLEEEAEEE
ncbi:MAG: DUF1292 domain-containing protein [Lachnospiraceae bacterium]|jgi:uncharacterized protein YrzB (UPF0473 family)|nr:DUF1292 domain-containing protein [Lachnospiraceae bacterium]